jgi:nucleoside-diphosphate-sugar epimerase
VFDNVLPALQLAEISASAGVERFIFASSGGTEYGSQLQRWIRMRDLPNYPASTGCETPVAGGY